MEKHVVDAAIRAGWKSHNDYRKKHGATALLLDKNLNEEAEKIAKDYLDEGHFKADGKNRWGHNEFRAQGVPEGEPLKEIMKDAVDEWYSHIEEYNWDAPLSSKDSAGLASQIIWRETTSLGIGIASQDDSMVIVALYSPPGNLPSNQKHKENVFKPQEN